MNRQPTVQEANETAPSTAMAERAASKSARLFAFAWAYIRFCLDFFILRRERPFVLGLVTNDSCNLRCVHCKVSNLGRPTMSYERVRAHLEAYYNKGARFLYLEGGEPHLWRDGTYGLQDIVALARSIGYLRVHLYTNGTMPLTARPDFTWISIDGLPATYEKIRGTSIQPVLRHARDLRQRFAIICVVNTINYREIEAFLAFVQQALPRAHVMFFFHTPYYGVDHLLLSPGQKKQAIDAILGCKGKGMPVLNSRAGLKAIRTGAYRRPTSLWWVVDHSGDYQCCRAVDQPEVCRECGYSSCAEIVLAQNLNPEACWTMLRCF